MTLDDLIARESIRDLVSRYNANGDTGRFERVFELFAEHAVMELGPPGEPPEVYNGREALKQIFLGAQGRIGENTKAGGPKYLRHFTATHQIDLIDADHATGRCYFQVLMSRGLDHWGRYVDRYVRIDGRWFFEHRRVYVDGQTEDSWFTK